MSSTPLPDTSDVLGSPEVGLVLWVVEPAPLARPPTGLAAGGFEAKDLMRMVASLGQKQLVTTEALAIESGPGHGVGRRPETPRP